MSTTENAPETMTDEELSPYWNEQLRRMMARTHVPDDPKLFERKRAEIESLVIVEMRGWQGRAERAEAEAMRWEAWANKFYLSMRNMAGMTLPSTPQGMAARDVLDAYEADLARQALSHLTGGDE